MKQRNNLFPHFHSRFWHPIICVACSENNLKFTVEVSHGLHIANGSFFTELSSILLKTLFIKDFISALENISAFPGIFKYSHGTTSHAILYITHRMMSTLKKNRIWTKITNK
jgi:hypothetical protein